MCETNRNQLVVIMLYQFEESLMFLLRIRSFLQSFLYICILHPRHDEHGNDQRCTQNNGNTKRKPFHEIKHHTLHCEQQREECYRYGKRCTEDGREKFLGSMRRCMPSAHTTVYLFYITVYDHNRIVYDHTERHNQRCQCHRIQFYPHRIEYTEGNKYRYRYRTRCHTSHPHRQQQHYDDDNRTYRYQQFLQKVDNGRIDHIALVCDRIHRDITRQSLLKIRQDVLYLFTELNYIITFIHFERQDNTLLTVILHIGVGIRIFPFYRSDIPQTYDITIRIGIHNLLCDIILCAERRFQMKRAHAVLIIYRTAHNGKSLR